MSLRVFWCKKKRETCSLGRRLTDAIRANSVDTVERLLKEARRKHRDKAVHIALRQALSAAVQEGQPRYVEMIVQAGCDPKTSPSLFKAAEYGHAGVIDLLLDYKCEVDHVYAGSNTALHVAVAKGHLECAELLMRRGADPTLRNCMSESGLTLAVVKDELSVLRVLLRHEKALEHTDVEGRTLLHLACRLGHLHAVDLLLTADCNPNVLDNNGCTPLMDAVLWRHQDIVQCLAPKCNVNFTGQRKTTALIYAAQTNEPDCLRVLLNEGAGVNDQDVMGNTALILGGPYYPVIEGLLSNKANPNVQNRYGMTALWYACYYHYRRVTALLLQANANPALPGNLRDRFRVSPFEIAFKRGHVSICRLLLSAGVPAEMVKPLLTSTFTKLFLEHPDSPSLLQEMQDHVSRPANLAQLTRLAIRARIGSVCLLQRAQQLPLPAQLRAYVCMEDLQRRVHEAASTSE